MADQEDAKPSARDFTVFSWGTNLWLYLLALVIAGIIAYPFGKQTAGEIWPYLFIIIMSSVAILIWFLVMRRRKGFWEEARKAQSASPFRMKGIAFLIFIFLTCLSNIYQLLVNNKQPHGRIWETIPERSWIFGYLLINITGLAVGGILSVIFLHDLWRRLFKR
ncbi:hypothetical protein AB4099_21585 [Bosea sp. 2KB_26]|uniref:hypothetical protein n=1 Tax=Bosea sp. 2KB_26 TaxID=3237475 RepID=UPI003F9398E3